jgi:fucose permease
VIPVLSNRAATASPETAADPWQILSGLVISGFLLALPGGLLPLWGYHIRPDFGTAGNYFVALGAGVAAGGAIARRFANTWPLERILTAGSFLAALALLMLSLAAPPAQVWYQMLALLLTGTAAGVINTAVLEGMTSSYDANPATITLMGGIAFGAGSVLGALLMSQAFGEDGAVRLLAVTAMLPAAAGVAFSRLRIPRIAVTEIALEETMRDLNSPLAILFALLLFFQFGNEWAIAGWLPVFLIDRLGLSPTSAVTLLAIYWTALAFGRIIAARLLSVISHGRILGLSAFFALFGCVLLMAARNQFGMITGLLLTGAGFSAIYPLSAERIASRFTYYHPGYFNGIFTFALMGGILYPFVLGHFADTSGLNVIPLSVMAGSCAVFALILIIWLGSKVSGSSTIAQTRAPDGVQ